MEPNEIADPIQKCVIVSEKLWRRAKARAAVLGQPLHIFIGNALEQALEVDPLSDHADNAASIRQSLTEDKRNENRPARTRVASNRTRG